VFLTKWTIRLAGHDVCEEAHERGREGALVTAYS
jgi:endonuclease YncB( thermonuclease family)